MVLLKRPWIFDNQFVVVHQCTPKLTASDPQFRTVQMWLQVRGLPNQWSSTGSWLDTRYTLSLLFECDLAGQW